MEPDFDGITKELIWCDRAAFPYEEIKRQAECALWQEYPERKWIAVRYPFAIGKDDYTKRSFPMWKKRQEEKLWSAKTERKLPIMERAY